MADGPILVPDFRRFAAGLDVEEAAFLHVQLQSVRGGKVMALRDAIMHRVLDDPEHQGVRERMEARFYRRQGHIKQRR